MSYLAWLIQNTKTTWWHDSAEEVELGRGLERGASGVTTNPFLANLAVRKDRALWGADIQAVLEQKLAPEKKAEALTRIVVTRAAARTPGRVCGQVNPLKAGDRDTMLAMARRYHQWAPNIAVKLPATLAGLDVLEDAVAEGITCTATVSFTVPQAVAIAERHMRGIERAKRQNIQPGKCFAVIMIGRLDDYLREVALDNRAPVTEDDIRMAGVAATKRAYAIYRERNYEAVLLVAALRGAQHLTELAGAELIMSIAPQFQEVFVSTDFPREERIAREVSPEIIARLRGIPEFVRAYEPDGMAPAEFIHYGVTQRTLSQFCEAGWKLLEAFE